MDVSVRSSSDIYDPIGQVGWLHWVSRKIVGERWSPYLHVIFHFIQRFLPALEVRNR
jgi:hypothetical protein